MQPTQALTPLPTMLLDESCSVILSACHSLRSSLEAREHGEPGRQPSSFGAARRLTRRNRKPPSITASNLSALHANSLNLGQRSAEQLPRIFSAVPVQSFASLIARDLGSPQTHNGILRTRIMLKDVLISPSLGTDLPGLWDHLIREPDQTSVRNGSQLTNDHAAAKTMIDTIYVIRDACYGLSLRSSHGRCLPASAALDITLEEKCGQGSTPNQVLDKDRHNDGCSHKEGGREKLEQQLYHNSERSTQGK